MKWSDLNLDEPDEPERNINEPEKFHFETKSYTLHRLH